MGVCTDSPCRSLILLAAGLFQDYRPAAGEGYRWTFHSPALRACVSPFRPLRTALMMYASGVATAKWVLVVDDDEDNRDSVVEMLQGAGYIATAAPEGTAALRMMGESAPALVVSDLRMPGMDGRELFTRARQLLGSSAPPFVFLTGLAPNLRTSLRPS